MADGKIPPRPTLFCANPGQKLLAKQIREVTKKDPQIRPPRTIGEHPHSNLLPFLDYKQTKTTPIPKQTDGK